jgi:DNA repair protein RadA/Sms
VDKPVETVDKPKKYTERAKKAWETRRANAAGREREAKRIDVGPVRSTLGEEEEKSLLCTLQELTARDVVKVPTKITDLDTALGGGFVRNSSILFAGRRGNGKSTLMTVVAGNMASDSSERILYVSGEEDGAQFAHRANRLSLPMTLKNLFVLEEANIDLIDKYANEVKPTMIIVDSIQSLKGRDMNGHFVANGRTSNYFTERLRRLRKKHEAILVLVGHETKQGDIAGNNALQHEVDAVLKLDPDPVTNAKVLEIDKNRFAEAGTTFRFMIRDRGIEAVGAIESMEYKGPELID